MDATADVGAVKAKVRESQGYGGEENVVLVHKGKVLTDDTGAKASAKLSIMAELSSMKITQDELIESSIGKIVSKLRKSR